MVALIAALAVSVALLVSRLDLAGAVALADAEALHVAYALHPQPAYLDHPGFIGWIASRLGAGSAPRDFHVFTALASTALPWIGVLAARACGAAPHAALRTFFPLALIPELSIGSFAFGPSLPLSFFWLLTIGAAGWALRHPPGRFGTLLACSAAGMGAALASLSKLSGFLLALSLLVVWLGTERRQRWRTLGPWAAAGLFGILVAPLVRWYLSGQPLPRLHVAPESPQVAMSLLRPLLAVAPPFLYAGAFVASDLGRHRDRSGVDRLLWYCLIVPLVPQVLLAIFAPGELEWLAPAYLTLSVHAARAPALRSSLSKSCIGLGVTVAALGWFWLRTDLPVRTGELLGGYDPLADTSNDLYSWGPGRPLLDSAVRAAHARTGQMPVIVGPHWTVCAQADVAVAGEVHVGCDSVELDDYDRWSRPEIWNEAQTILYVTDSRFQTAPPDSFQGRSVVATHATDVTRFGRSVRRIMVSEFEREAEAAAASPAP